MPGFIFAADGKKLPHSRLSLRTEAFSPFVCRIPFPTHNVLLFTLATRLGAVIIVPKYKSHPQKFCFSRLAASPDIELAERC